ncbi:hypothetical protein EC973_009222 [Apophysomyces ossiformis]|uniref:Uncharacterized protein n=1 Tax=Apophysomyces ossiformis TaxID=679940 RepID=A0A8H7BRE6_9FUNG|nr:hypothetical protein EC973_009222 [Apophysomyces ossiformis]
MTQPVRFQSLTDPLAQLALPDTGKNAGDVICPKETCRCVILRKNKATLVKRDANKMSMPETALPEGIKVAENDTDNDHFWSLDNMMDFENVGFSNTVGSIKYLSCADCDIGPLGYHDIASEPKEFLISICRARYQF